MSEFSKKIVIFAYNNQFFDTSFQQTVCVYKYNIKYVASWNGYSFDLFIKILCIKIFDWLIFMFSCFLLVWLVWPRVRHNNQKLSQRVRIEAHNDNCASGISEGFI